MNNQSSSGSMKTPEFSIGGLLANQFRKNQPKEGNLAYKKYNESNKAGNVKDEEFETTDVHNQTMPTFFRAFGNDELE